MNYALAKNEKLAKSIDLDHDFMGDDWVQGGR